MLMDRLEISERRACRAIGQPRTTQRRGVPVPPDEEQVLRTRLRQLARARPRLWVSPDDGPAPRRGLLRQPQADPAPVPGRRPPGGEEGQEAVPSGHLDGAGRPSPGRPSGPRLDARLLLRPDHEPEDAEGPGRGRRVHQGGPGPRGGPVDHRRSHRVGAGADRGFHGPDTGAPSDGQRHRAHCPRPSGLVPLLRPPPPATSNLVTPGRTRSSSPSTASSATSCSTAKPSRPCSRPKCWPRTSASTTTRTDPTRH